MEILITDILSEVFEKLETSNTSDPDNILLTPAVSRFPKPLQLALESPSVSPAFNKMMFFPKDISPKKRKRKNFDEEIRYPRAYTSKDMIAYLKLQEQRKIEAQELKEQNKRIRLMKASERKQENAKKKLEKEFEKQELEKKKARENEEKKKKLAEKLEKKTRILREKEQKKIKEIEIKMALHEKKQIEKVKKADKKTLNRRKRQESRREKNSKVK